jgi:uncharacterized protein (DUF433 family)
MENLLTQHVEITPGVAGGKPHIVGHRISEITLSICKTLIARRI